MSGPCSRSGLAAQQQSPLTYDHGVLMPILAQETSLYPENLLDEFTLAPSQRQWWAVYTKARQEKALARQLVKFDVPFYLPLVAKDTLVRGRKVKSYVPLFGGYVFLYGDEEERVRSLTTNRISQILPVTDGDQMRKDLHHVQSLIQADAPLTVERRLQPGQPVRIKSGPMKDTEGTVVKYRGKTRLVVAVNFLQQGVSVEIDGFRLEPIG